MSQYITIDGLRLHYVDQGEGEPILLLHGWPTSAFLWRNIIPALSVRNRVIALDLPGFGNSEKSLESSYSFRFYASIISNFLDALEIKAIGLTVHDLGGPIGLYWAAKNPDRVTKLALLNTIVYSNFSWAVILFGVACRLPLVRTRLASPAGLNFAMRIGTSRTFELTREIIEGVQAPFQTREAREALLRAGSNLHPDGFKEIEAWLPYLTIPVRVVYGEQDRILPDVAQTMARVKRDLPQTTITSLPSCGHFLQEEQPDQIGEMLADFFAPQAGA
ncbi:MAG: alpha/beta fold hydrolase [Chloroflexota bacterium]